MGGRREVLKVESVELMTDTLQDVLNRKGDNHSTLQPLNIVTELFLK